MDSRSASTELFSLILILILILYVKSKSGTRLPYGRIYLFCLYLSAGIVTLSLMCAFCVLYGGDMPAAVSISLIGIYYLAAPGLGTLLVYHTFQLMLDHIYEKRRLKRAGIMLLAMYASYFLICAAGMGSGAFFSFDRQKGYQLGKWFWLGYLVLGVEVFYFFLCVWKNRKSISSRMWHVIRILPATVLFLVVYQLAFPEYLLNGCIIVVTDLILLFHFQGRWEDTDRLTSINNRDSLYQELELRLAGKQSFQAIAIGLDQYIAVNRNYGYKKGDELLIRCACWLRDFHPQGRVYRISNVSFVVLLPFCGEDEADRNLRKIRERFDSPWEMDGTGIHLRARVAEVIHLQQDWNAQDVMDLLRFSLGRAAFSENRLVRLEEKISAQVERRGMILHRLNQALENDFFEIWYQPIYDCRNGRFTQAEALIRLRGENGELLMPDEFLPVAESAGMLDEIGLILIKKVCRFLGTDRMEELEAVSVNLSAQQLLSERICRCMQDSMKTSGIPASRLCIEITEGALEEGIDRVRRRMKELSADGIRFYLDDFGKGESNLARVLELPFSYIKLDKSLINGFPDERNSRIVVESMLELFHKIGCGVIAEGTETRAQVELLKKSGADLIQGFWFARPMPEEELLVFLDLERRKQREAGGLSGGSSGDGLQDAPAGN